MPPAIDSYYSDVVVADNNMTVRSESVSSLSSTIDAQHNKNSSTRYQFSLVQDNDTNTTTSYFKLNIPSNQYKPTTKEIAIQKVLSSIIILNSPTSPQVINLLSKYNGKLLSIGTSILHGLYNAAPINNDTSCGGFTGRARVGDYNENLFYHMELKDMNLIDIIQNNSMSFSSRYTNDQQQEGVDSTTTILQEEIKTFESTLRNTLNQQAISYRGSFMSTEQTMYQPAHVDYDYTILSKYGKRLYLAFFPLTLDGAYLQLWQKKEKKVINDHNEETQRDEVDGTVVYIPYGQMLLLPSDTIHGGGFKRGDGGNLRFHLYIALDDEEDVRETEGEGEKKKEINLLDHPMNKYTEEHDRRRELCERYVNAPGLDTLLSVFFDDGVSCNEDGEESPIPANEEEEPVEVSDDIEVQKLANAVKGVDLSGMKSLDFMKEVGSVGTKRNSASYVNLYGLTDDEEVV